jgi:transposase InsO family protein
VKPIQFLDHHQQPVLIPAFLDIGSGPSFIRRDVFAQLHAREDPTTDVFQQPDKSILSPKTKTALYFGVPDESSLSLSIFYIMDDFFVPLLLGRRELKLLPFKVLLDGKPIFEGAIPPQPKTFPPELPVGQGINFAAGDRFQQKLITDVLVQYQRSVFEWSGQMGVFAGHVVDLPTVDEIPVARQPFHVGPHKVEALKAILEEYKRRDWIEESTSPYGSPAFLHPKKTPPGLPQKWRLVEDYTALNHKLQDDPYPVPAVQELIDMLGPQASWFISLDLTSGYHHCPLTVSARKKTAFVTPLGTFQYKVLPFGLKTAPRVFQRILESILREHLKVRCLVYLDDIIIFGATFNELLQNFKLIMATLSAAGAALGIKKCVFLAREIQYLGNIISNGTVRPAPEATKAVLDFPQPTTIKGLQRFLGLATYIRGHIPHMAILERRIRTAIPKAPTAPLQWTPDALAAFEETKAAVHRVATLTIFDPAAAHIVLADASSQALGAVLLQQTDDTTIRPVAFASRVLSDPETRYSNSEREALALKWAVTNKFRPYLEGRHFILGTDHKALLGDIRLKPHTTRLARLMLQLAPFDFELRHIPAADMGVADALSRATTAAISSGPSSPVSRKEVILQCHEQLGHANWKKVLQELRQRVSWPGLRQLVWSTIFTCVACRKFNPPASRVGGELQPIVATRPKEKLVVDILGPLPPDERGRKFAFITVDHFSRFATVQMLARPTARATIAALKEVFRQLGEFDWVLSDPGPQFTSVCYGNFLRSRGVLQYLGSPRNYHATGTVERLARTLKTIAAKFKPQDVTARALITAVEEYNRTPHTATGTSPIAAFFGVAPRLPLDDKLHTAPARPPTQTEVRAHSQRYSDSWSRRMNRNRPKFQIGDEVLYHLARSTVQAHDATRHLLPRTQGPFRITAPVPFNRYRVTDGINHFVLPASKLRYSRFSLGGGE